MSGEVPPLKLHSSKASLFNSDAHSAEDHHHAAPEPCTQLEDELKPVIDAFHKGEFEQASRTLDKLGLRDRIITAETLVPGSILAKIQLLAMGLIGLPNELLLKILNMIPGVAILAPISQVCKKLYHISQDSILVAQKYFGTARTFRIKIEDAGGAAHFAQGFFSASFPRELPLSFKLIRGRNTRTTHGDSFRIDSFYQEDVQEAILSGELIDWQLLINKHGVLLSLTVMGLLPAVRQLLKVMSFENDEDFEVAINAMLIAANMGHAHILDELLNLKIFIDETNMRKRYDIGRYYQQALKCSIEREYTLVVRRLLKVPLLQVDIVNGNCIGLRNNIGFGKQSIVSEYLNIPLIAQHLNNFDAFSILLLTCCDFDLYIFIPMIRVPEIQKLHGHIFQHGSTINDNWQKELDEQGYDSELEWTKKQQAQSRQTPMSVRMQLLNFVLKNQDIMGIVHLADNILLKAAMARQYKTVVARLLAIEKVRKLVLESPNEYEPWVISLAQEDSQAQPVTPLLNHVRQPSNGGVHIDKELAVKMEALKVSPAQKSR